MKHRTALILNIAGILLAITSTIVALGIYYAMRGSIISLINQLCAVGPCYSIVLPNEGFIILPAVIGVSLMIAGTSSLYAAVHVGAKEPRTP